MKSADLILVVIRSFGLDDHFGYLTLQLGHLLGLCLYVVSQLVYFMVLFSDSMMSDSQLLKMLLLHLNIVSYKDVDYSIFEFMKSRFVTCRPFLIIFLRLHIVNILPPVFFIVIYFVRFTINTSSTLRIARFFVVLLF